MKNCSNNCESDQDPGVLSSPVSFLRSGYFYWSGGNLYSRGNIGNFWSIYSANTTSSSHLNLNNAALGPQGLSTHGFGFAVRCDKSFTYLINTSYSMKISKSEYYDAGVLSNPLSFLHSGYFDWDEADLDSRGSSGYHWLLRSSSTTNSNNLDFYNTYLNPQHNSAHGYGFAVRQILHQPHQY